jgi:RHS repeat-associated protein
MMPASKHGDPQLGVDIHLCVVPPSPSPVPLPTPHISVVFDPFDYIPYIGATVTVCGMKRATAGTNGMVVHIPPGFPFAPKLPDKDDELFMGSSTVVADGDPFSFIAVPVLGCQVAGMISIPRLKKKGSGKKAMLLPTTFNLAIPTSVVVGGPPTISLMGMAFKGAFAALGKFAKSGVFKRFRQKLFGGLKPGFLKCVILRAEPVNILTGEVSVQQEDFLLPGRIPIEWSRAYTSGNDHEGLCGHGWETPADTRLEIDPVDGIVSMHNPAVGPLYFGRLPVAVGDEAGELEMVDGALLTEQGDEYCVRTKEDRIYHFPKAIARVNGRGGLEYPIGRIADLCGNWLDFDRRGDRLTAINESAGRRIDLEIEDGRIREVALRVPGTDVRHTLVRYEYDQAGDLVAVIDVLGHSHRFAYDEHHLVSHTDRNGLSFYYDYDTTGEDWRVTHSWGDGGLYNYHFEYVDVLNERRITDSLGHVSIVKLDDRGLPISEIDPLGGMTIFEYDEAGRTTAVVDASTQRTEYHYDEAGNLLKVVRPDGAVLATAFDGHNRPLSIADANGAAWQQRWDDRGLLIEQTSALGHVRHYEYDGWGQTVAYTNPRGARTRLLFDVVGNLTGLHDALGNRTLFAHDVLGRVIEKRDAFDRRTTYRYDAKGRLTDVTMPSGSTIACAYDPADNLTSYTDENGAVTRLEYFGQGKVARRIQPDGNIVECLYDTEERLIGVRNQRGELYQLRRDALGRVVEEIDYWGQSRRYAYNRAGFLTASLDPLGRRIEYACDALGRVTQKRVPGLADDPRPVETFVYDAAGNLIETANEHVKVVRAFDAEGRLLKEVQDHTGGQQFRVENGYDAQGNRIKRTTSSSAGSGHTVEFAFDLLDLLVGVSVDGEAPLRLQRDALGQLTHEELAPGLNRHFTYNADGDITEQTLSSGVDRLIAMRYEYDAVGNLTARDDSQFGRDAYVYDPMGRILEHTDPRRVVHKFFNDLAGDQLITQVMGSGSVSIFTGSSDDWRREGQHQGIRCCFDRAGNLTVKHDTELRLELTWDARQRLIASRKTDRDGQHSTTTYAYDPLGRRLFKETSGERTWFGWDGDAMALDVTGTESREFVYRPETFEPVAMLAARPFLYVNDPNGCPTRLIDQHGHMWWAANYSLGRGVGTVHCDEVHNPIRLQGQYADSETNLSYNRNRYFDPHLGCFVSQDPVRLIAGSHVYAYAPNTFGWVDPLGLNPTCRMTGRAVTNATDLPIVRRGTRQWDEAVDAIRRHGRGDIRVETIQDAKALLREARGNMDRRKNYTQALYSKGYEVHNTHNAASRAREMAVGNDLRHVKWTEGTSKADWSEGHIFFGNVF